MTKLNQLLAVHQGVKAKAHETITEQLNKVLKKPDLFAGLTRDYQKNNDDDTDLPSERKRVQATVPGVLELLARVWGELITYEAHRDITNTIAKGNVVIDGVTLLSDVPVPHLLFLEKQAVDLRTIVEAIPILDEADDWSKDPATGWWKSAPVKTHKTKKIEKPLILYDATKEHPAQVKMVTEDVIVGFWTQIKFSGAMQKTDRESLMIRVDKLIRALKEAREAANNTEVVKSEDFGKKIFGFILEG